LEAEEKPKHTWNKVNHWATELEILQTIISKTNLVETIKWGAPVYTLNGKNIVGITGFKNHFALWFYKGVDLKDEYKVLVNAQEGVTKSLRQWRFTSKSEINEKLILEYIEEAKNLEIKKKKPRITWLFFNT
jgi:uncharacterized protein YdeI (YjbR/CyaY-like superfamily)